jgi:asparagine synthase (glutamine-hydrolysing)
MGLGEPFGDTSALAVWSLCAQARRLGKVALSGDGGDELFFGYTGLRKQRQARRLRAVPDSLARGAISVLSGSGATWPRRIAKALRLSRKDDTGLLIDWHRRWDVGALPALLSPPRYDALFPDGEGQIPAVRELVGNGASGFPERQIRFHMLVDLPSDCLFKVNRMSMAHGVEVRVPLLSNSLLEFGSRLPAAARQAGGRTKEPLRTVAETMTPYLRQPSPKHGFGFPLDAFLRGKIAPAWRSWGVTAILARTGFVPAAVDALVARYEIESASPGYASRHLSSRLFDLLLIALWVETFEIRV